MVKRVTNATAEAVAAIETAAAAAAAPMPEGFARLLYGRVVAEDLLACPPPWLAESAAQAHAFLTAPRPAGEIRLRFRDETLSDPGRERQITILEVLNDNKPFLLDSTLAELAEQGAEPSLVAHPILAVARGADGAFQTLAGEAAGRAPEGTRRESLIHLHLDRIDAPDARERLRAGL